MTEADPPPPEAIPPATPEAGPPQAPVVAALSPDRRYVWDGAAWREAQYSPNGAWVWDGRSWLAVPAQTFSGALGIPSQVIEFTFDVGTQEHHQVHFRFDQTIGTLTIDVDGRRAVEQFQLFSLSLTAQWRLTVGEQERHDVLIQKTRKLLLAGLRPQTCSVFVDGQHFGVYEGNAWIKS